MNEQQIEDIKNALREMVRLLTERGQPLTDEIRAQVVRAMEHAATRITQLRQEQQQPQPEQEPIQPEGPGLQPQGREPFQGRPQETINEAPPSGPAQLLWILAGQNEDVFRQYLETYPDPALNALRRNPVELDRVIEYLNAMMPEGAQPVQDGIPHAEINSSNIYGFRYDPKTSRLLVRFQNGGVYGYSGVPQNVYNMFRTGAVPAKTDGQNQYGRWWKNKVPSIGASFYELIRQGGYPHQRLS